MALKLEQKLLRLSHIALPGAEVAGREIAMPVEPSATRTQQSIEAELPEDGSGGTVLPQECDGATSGSLETKADAETAGMAWPAEDADTGDSGEDLPPLLPALDPHRCNRENMHKSTAAVAADSDLDLYESDWTALVSDDVATSQVAHNGNDGGTAGHFPEASQEKLVRYPEPDEYDVEGLLPPEEYCPSCNTPWVANGCFCRSCGAQRTMTPEEQLQLDREISELNSLDQELDKAEDGAEPDVAHSEAENAVVDDKGSASAITEVANSAAEPVESRAEPVHIQDAHIEESQRDTGPLQWDDGAAVVVESKDGEEQTLFFPNGFVWGTATSAYQIEGATEEGGRSPSIWDTFSATPGRVANGDTGKIACDHYHRWREDVQLMRELEFQAYRFSISWSRLLPKGRGELNPEAIEFYSGLIDELLANDIQPWVTIYHWDLPQCLEDEYGGWLDRQVIEDFENYAVACFSAFGDRVSNWITFNEPWCSAVLGYANAEMAPGRDHEPEREPYLVAHHIILAHARAVRRYRAEFKERQKGQIGITLNMDWKEPLTESVSDSEAQGRSLDWQLGWFADPIWHGDYPRTMRRRLGSRLPAFTASEKQLIRDTSDFFGLNHYSTKFISARPAHMKASPDEVQELGGYFDDTETRDKDDPRWATTAMGWPVVPWGLKKLLEFIQSEYLPKGGIYITENGCAARGESDYLVPAKNDVFRVDYFKGYLAQVHKAIQGGVDVRGYFAWSFMDNFEWHHGYSKRFGIVHVSYKTQVRTPKASARFMAEVSRMNAVQIATSLLCASDFRPIEDPHNARDRLEAIRSEFNSTKNHVLELKIEGTLGAEEQSLVEEVEAEANAASVAVRDLKSQVFFANLGIKAAIYYDYDAFAEHNAYENKVDARSTLEDIVVYGVDVCKNLQCGGFCIYDNTLYFRRQPADQLERCRVPMPGCTLVVVQYDNQEDPEHGEMTTWTVVGTNGRNGIWVRKGEDPTSALLGQLSLGARVRQIEAVGVRLHYEKIDGDGPDFGWVSTKVGEVDVLVRDG